jgi:dTDP-4-dehydrorhamnose reductase
MSGRPVWITGAGGLIGSHLVQTAPKFAPDRQIAALARRQLDLTDFAAVARAFSEQRPEAVVHCAALSRVAICESDPVLASKVNVEVTRHLCELAADIPLFLFSTDVVFDGKKGGYVEADPVHPLSVYAETKTRAEQIVLMNPRHTVLRTSLNTGLSPTGDRSFTEQMRRALERGERLRLYADEYRCPIPATVTARAVWELLGRGRPGLYHLAGSERLSRWEIGQLLMERWPQFAGTVERSSVESHRGPARCPDTSLNCSKLQALLSFPLPGLTQWLEENPDEPV